MNNLLVFLSTLFVMVKVIKGQGCERMFGRVETSVTNIQGSPDSPGPFSGFLQQGVFNVPEEEIAQKALAKLCLGGCSFSAPVICPLYLLELQETTIGGFVGIPQYDMQMLTTTNYNSATQQYLLNITFDFNIYTKEAFITQFTLSFYMPQSETSLEDAPASNDGGDDDMNQSEGIDDSDYELLIGSEPEPEIEMEILSEEVLDEKIDYERVTIPKSSIKFLVQSGGQIKKFQKSSQQICGPTAPAYMQRMAKTNQ
eukprot:TRINITY_DN4325_c0_g1_i1.p2 TRINITY_DN4325_c0_g1~~TRINITY_DN4325_c0_g1_i1.p2  ORF type:complete len:256 (+),score=19.75 TRINITY_DN4325_c0_g1_i1:293-1060(+)